MSYTVPGMRGPGGPEGPAPSETLAEHLGEESWLLPVLTSTWPSYEHVNVQGALDSWLARNGAPFKLVGVTGFRHRVFGLPDLCQPGSDQGMAIGGVPMADHPSGPGEQTRSCVQCGLYLVDGVDSRDGGDQTEDPRPPMAVLLRGSDQRGPQPDVSVEIACADRAAAKTALAEIRHLAVELSVSRGHVLEFGGGDPFSGHRTLLNFLDRPAMRREELILPPDMLEGIESQILGVNKHRETLLAHGQHLKRGVLLYGAPGTGKTHTLRYLMSRLPETTVVILTGMALQLIREACAIARVLEPALVVVEDVDLVAQDRSMGPTNPMLFTLLNEMDGLDGDADVTFLLTTNRVDVLEPALAMRPGRVDHAVEVPLPDTDGRLRLLELYRGGLELDLSNVDALIERMDGVTASFIKELIRRAALIAAEARREATAEDRQPLHVSAGDLGEAMDILAGSRHQLTRRLLGAPDELGGGVVSGS